MVGQNDEIRERIELAVIKIGNALSEAGGSSRSTPSESDEPGHSPEPRVSPTPDATRSIGSCILQAHDQTLLNG